MVYKSKEVVVERFKEIMEKLEMDATTLSKKIGVEPSSISHILSGRNKPSFNFLSKLAETFPQLNINWLVTGKGEMLIDKNINYVKQKGESSENQLGGLFSENIDTQVQNNPNENNKPTTTLSDQSVQQKVSIDKVIIFYTDGTFEYYNHKE